MNYPRSLVFGVVALAVTFVDTASAQTLLSYWNFNNVSPAFNSSTGALGSFNTASNGSGEIYTTTGRKLSSNTASGAVVTSAYIDLSGLGYSGGNSGGADFTEIVNGIGPGGVRQTTSSGSGGFGTFNDSTLNRTSGDSTTGNSLMLMNGNNSEANRYFTLTSLDSTGYQNLQLSYATRWQANTSGTQTWTYSTDGVTFLNVPGGALTMASSPGSSTFTTFSLDLSSVSALNNTSAFYLRMTLTAPGTGFPGSVSFDNLQLTGISTIPEPASWAGWAGTGCLALLVARRRFTGGKKLG